MLTFSSWYLSYHEKVITFYVKVPGLVAPMLPYQPGVRDFFVLVIDHLPGAQSTTMISIARDWRWCYNLTLSLSPAFELL